MKRSLRIAGLVYLAGVVLMTIAILSLHYKHGLDVGHLPRELMLILLWPVALAIIVASWIGIIPLE